MARPKTPPHERVAKCSHRDGAHLIWDGPMHRGKPHMHHVGNPARVLLDLVGHDNISIKPDCYEPRCIEPTHWRVIIERQLKYDDAPKQTWRDPRDPTLVQFNDRELEEIQMLVAEETVDEDELNEFYRPEIVAEILKRRATA
ncbi:MULTISPECIES: hypothetical protein [unclassified Mesorhizobium]|uniref:hypothetical protein n=1 Tax=unclassified Mesorhizobium TaxID=325217 RepID=UPI000FD80713|nr:MULTISPECIES: hypothetical protein [unclassified Mesorhizobium]TGV97050.1 hypothetical protein EN797_035165 [Mesorhizobium sp. M2E.F.Ca.ET.154.01.1.1]